MSPLNVCYDDPDEGHKPKHTGTTVKLFLFSVYLGNRCRSARNPSSCFSFLIKSWRRDNTSVFSERKSQGLQEPDNQVFGGNAAVSTTGNHSTITRITFSMHVQMIKDILHYNNIF